MKTEARQLVAVIAVAVIAVEVYVWQTRWASGGHAGRMTLPRLGDGGRPIIVGMAVMK